MWISMGKKLVSYESSNFHCSSEYFSFISCVLYLCFFLFLIKLDCGLSVLIYWNNTNKHTCCIYVCIHTYIYVYTYVCKGVCCVYTWFWWELNYKLIWKTDFIIISIFSSKNKDLILNLPNLLFCHLVKFFVFIFVPHFSYLKF